MLLDSDISAGSTVREFTRMEQIGAFRFSLRCIFCYEFKGRDKEEKLPANRLVVTNAGVKVFEQISLIIKPGKQYIWTTESDKGTRYENPEDSGLKYYWVIVDFDKASSPIMPSRFEIQIEQKFSKELLELIQSKIL